MTGDQRREELGFDGGLVSGALRMGRVVWVEQALAAALGDALQRTDDDGLVVALADRIRGHAARAALVEARLPTLREFPLDVLVDGTGLDGWSGFLAAQRGEPADRVIAVRDTVAMPVLVAGYERILTTASPVAAPSVRRLLEPAVDALRAELDRLAPGHPPDVPPSSALEPLDR